MKEQEDNTGDSILHNAGLVMALGTAVFLLGFIRLFGVQVSNLFLLGISTSSLLLIIMEALRIKGRKILLYQSLALIALICLPNIPALQKIDNNYLAQYNDSFSLFVMGLTLFLISQKGLREIVSILGSNNQVIHDLKKQLEHSEEKYHQLIVRIEEIQNEVKDAKTLAEEGMAILSELDHEENEEK